MIIVMDFIITNKLSIWLTFRTAVVVNDAVLGLCKVKSDTSPKKYILND